MEDGDGPDPGHGLDPEAVEEIDFAKVRRGYEPESVRARLGEAAEEIRRLNALVGSLSDRITELEATPPETLESRRVAEALGDEATRVLQSATDAAQVQIERAEAEHARIVGEAEATAAAVAEEGRERGKNMVVEAQTVRERILADLARKRHEHRVEVEQLRVTRERLLEALGIFRQGLDGWIEELVQAEPRAAAAAEQAGLRVAAQPESTVAELEAEISTARLAGARATDDAAGGAADADTTPDQEGEAAAAGTAAVASDADEAETPDEADEPEAVGEYVDLEGLTIESSPAPAPAAAVRLYDVEAEPNAVFDSGAEPQEGQASEAPDDAVAATDQTEPAAGAPPVDAEAIFARLRSITSQPVGEPEPRSAESGVTDDGAAPPAEADEPDEFPDEFDDEFDDEIRRIRCHRAGRSRRPGRRGPGGGGGRDRPQAQAAGSGRAGRSARRRAPQRGPSRAIHDHRRHRGLHPSRPGADAGLRVRHRREHRRRRPRGGRQRHPVDAGRAGPGTSRRIDRGHRRPRRAHHRSAIDLPGVPIAPGGHRSRSRLLCWLAGADNVTVGAHRNSLSLRRPIPLRL